MPHSMPEEAEKNDDVSGSGIDDKSAEPARHREPDTDGASESCPTDRGASELQTAQPPFQTADSVVHNVEGTEVDAESTDEAKKEEQPSEQAEVEPSPATESPAEPPPEATFPIESSGANTASGPLAEASDAPEGESADPVPESLLPDAGLASPPVLDLPLANSEQRVPMNPATAASDQQEPQTSNWSTRVWRDIMGLSVMSVAGLVLSLSQCGFVGPLRDRIRGVEALVLPASQHDGKERDATGAPDRKQTPRPLLRFRTVEQIEDSRLHRVALEEREQMQLFFRGAILITRDHEVVFAEGTTAYCIASLGLPLPPGEYLVESRKPSSAWQKMVENENTNGDAQDLFLELNLDDEVVIASVINNETVDTHARARLIRTSTAAIAARDCQLLKKCLAHVETNKIGLSPGKASDLKRELEGGLVVARCKATTR